ncbi:fibronectin type III domain-containing protein [Thiothrix subterranea]|uniref:Polysaccharide deacetylase family protein n=1 Tax=Thiothrix subterranea TaxID=2735563 RepID=A0AA51R5E7_9GAMM|nr:polysaccharide deacetylase family protein [Thiothrix subterranea]WML87591.1 polysaccharide deacetylase family protein [Thiothrix subterranea]
MRNFFKKWIVIYWLAVVFVTSVQAATNQPGVVLTFDDTSTGLWHNFFANRTDNVRATFFVTKWHELSRPTQIDQLRDLQNKGYEIGCHSYDHTGVGEFLFNPSRTQEYVNTQVIPAIQNMQADGFDPVSFSYPSGERDENYDAAIRPYLPYLRTTFYDAGKQLAQMDEIYHNSDKTYGVLEGESLDNRYGRTVAEIEQALIRAKNNNEIITLYGHYIFDDTSPDADSQYAIRASKLNQIIDIAKGLGLKFYTFKEAFDLTNGIITPPLAPTSLTATALSNSQVRLNWVDASSDETGFKIERCQGATCTGFAEVGTVSANGITFSDSNLVSNTSYRYRIRAYRGTNHSSYSSTVTTATLAAPSLLAAPTSLTATALSSSQVRLNWVDASSNETGFKIERCLNAACTNFTVIKTTGANIVQFTNTNLQANKNYRYRIRAYRGTVYSDYSNTVDITVSTPSTAIAAPANLTATVLAGNKVRLNWIDASNNETGFEVERCLKAGCTSFEFLGSLAANAVSFTDSDSTLESGESYRYRVRAYQTNGTYSAYSNIIALNM